MCNQSSLDRHAEEFSLIRLIFNLLAEALQNVSIIALCKRHDSQSFLILCLDLRKTFISVIEMQTNC